MKQVILPIVLGILLLILSIFLAFMYMKGRGSPWLLMLSVFIAVVSLFFLLRARKSTTAKSETNMSNGEKDQSNITVIESKSILDKTNAITSQWNKTVEMKDRLKLLKISSSGGTSNS